MIHRQLGQFQITAKLGAGGMGEVYRASDTKLGREVAIKVLPSSLTQTPDGVARWERTALPTLAVNQMKNASDLYTISLQSSFES